MTSNAKCLFFLLMFEDEIVSEIEPAFRLRYRLLAIGFHASLMRRRRHCCPKNNYLITSEIELAVVSNNPSVVARLTKVTNDFLS